MFDAFKSGKLCIYDRERQSYKIIDSEILFDMFYKETKIVDFETTPESVLVLTKNPSHLLVYDLEMNLQKTLPLAFRARNFKILPNNDLIFYKTLDAEEGESSDYFYHLIRTDPTGKFIEGRYPFTIPEGQRVYIDLNYPLGNYGQYVSYNKTFSDTVFVISNSLSTFHDKIVVGLKHKVLDKQEYNKPEMFNKIQSDRDLHNPLGLVNFIADDHSLSFSLAQNNEKTIYMKNKYNDKSSFGLYISVGQGEGILPPPFFKQGETFISVINEDFLSRIPIENVKRATYKKIYDDVLNNGASYVVYYRTKKNSSPNP